MGSSGSSKCTVPNLGVSETKKRMILDDGHKSCVVKTKLETIPNNVKFSYLNDINDKNIKKNDKWFYKFLGKVFLDFTEEERKKYVKSSDSDDEIVFNEELKSILVQNSDYVQEVYDLMTDKEQDIILENFHLDIIRWFYQRIGSHRVLQLDFYCKKCGKNKYIEMDKTTKGKNINYARNDYDPPQWWHWKKINLKYTYTFIDILRYYNYAPNYYNWATNNCKDFAKSIYNKIEGTQTY